MMVFWSAAAVMIAAALWFVINPLMQRRAISNASRRATAIVASEGKPAELETDQEDGALDAGNSSNVGHQLDRGLVEDAGGKNAAKTARCSSMARWLAPSVGLLLPATAVSLYLALGGEAGILDTTAAPAAAQATLHAQGKSNLSVEEAAERLAKRLEREPNDIDGWLLLANSYRYLGRAQDAEAAMARAKTLGAVQSASAGNAIKAMETAVTAVPAEAPPTTTQGPATPHAIDTMVTRLKQKLASQPDNAEGWAMLGRSYQALKRYTDAGAAYNKAVSLRPDDATLLADYADVLAAANGGWLPGEPERLVGKALSIDATNRKALWLAASAARQRGDHVQALQLWQRLAAMLSAGDEDSQIIADNIAEARAALAGNNRPDAAIANGDATATSGVQIRGKVTIAPTLAQSVEANDTVFIFARAVQGPPMPLAVLRRQGKDLPTDFVLDDSMAMTPATSLSNHAEVIIGARVSKSGDTKPQPGDLEGLSGVVKVDRAGFVEIVIDHPVS